MATACWTSAGVAPLLSTTIWAIGTSTSATFLAVNSKAADRVPEESASIPSRVDCSTMPATSSRV